MTESLQSPVTHQDPVQELESVISQLEAYRERLSNDTMTMAKRAKVLRSKALNDLEPELVKIDETLESLKTQLSQLKHQE